MSAKRLVVFGGNGFVGSAICRSAVARGWQVTSLSRSGLPFVTSNGFAPGWVDKVDWQKGTPFDPSTYIQLLPESDAVISTLGVLFESSYKKDGDVDPLQVGRQFLRNLSGDKGNPLRRTGNDRSYERMNRDSAVLAFREFAKSTPKEPSAIKFPFVFISAEDISRPFVDSGYIAEKRKAEEVIDNETRQENPEFNRAVRPIFVRPSVIYHPHIRPFSTVPATLLSASSHLQSFLPKALRATTLFPPQASVTSTLGPITSSIASMLTIPPIHVDTIGESVCKAIEDDTFQGVLDVRQMRKMLDFDDKFDLQSP